MLAIIFALYIFVVYFIYHIVYILLSHPFITLLFPISNH